MWTILVPVLVIGGIFAVFYLFKDKFIGKTVEAYNTAAAKWADKEAVMAEFISDENKFKMLQDAVGDTKIECIISAKPKKNVVGKTLKKGAELLVGVETFDMSAHYLVIAGNELCYLHSDGKKIVDNIAYDLNALSKVVIKQDSGVTTAAKFLTGTGAQNGKKPYSLTFTSKDADYSFNLNPIVETYAKFNVGKNSVGNNSKFGDNPFYRVAASNVSEDQHLLFLYSDESFAKFQEIMSKKQ